MKTKCDNVIIPNTWGDLVDTDLNENFWELTDEGVKNESKISPEVYSQTIDSLKNIPIGRKYAEMNGEVLIDNYFTLSSFITKIPHGIVDKKRPGIGATTVEINSRRNSIIVVPTKNLAYNKTIKHLHCQYVGSRISLERGTTLRPEIERYLNNNEIKYKKVIVVADSLKKVTDIIGDKVFNNYFLMVDEVDMLQSDSNYRPRLESVMDIYFKFNKRNRCLLTATMKEFSNPLLQYETRFDLTDFKPKRKIHVIHTDNINAAVKKGIESYSYSEKILIAYNSISQIMGIIYNLDEKLQKDCSILCSEASKKETDGYYAELTSKNELPNRIVFMTCSYFAGVDIEDKYHLITVSNAEKFYQILSIDKMTQISGRCRVENGLLSETIVYNTPNNSATLGCGDIKDRCLNKAQKIINLYEFADEMSKNDTELVKLFSVVKKAIQEKANEKIGGEEISLTRKNIEGKYVPAYFNIDSIVEKEILDSGYYMDKDMLVNELSQTNKILSRKSILIKKEESQLKAEEKSISNLKEQTDLDINKAIDIIKQLNESGTLDANLKGIMSNSKNNVKEFYERFIKLYKYADIDIILNLLSEIRDENKKSFKGVNNAVIFWALEDNHPFKINLSNELRLGEVYTANELHELLTPMIGYHLFKGIKPRTSISLIKGCYVIERPRTKYKVIGENPKGFKEHKLRISKDENLINYFMI